MKFHVIEKRVCWVYFDHEVEASTPENAKAAVSLGESVSTGHKVINAPCGIYETNYEVVLARPNQNDFDTRPVYDTKLTHAENLNRQTEWQKQFNDCTICYCSNYYVQCSACGWWGFVVPEEALGSA